MGDYEGLAGLWEEDEPVVDKDSKGSSGTFDEPLMNLCCTFDEPFFGSQPSVPNQESEKGSSKTTDNKKNKKEGVVVFVKHKDISSLCLPAQETPENEPTPLVHSENMEPERFIKGSSKVHQACFCRKMECPGRGKVVRASDLMEETEYCRDYLSRNKARYPWMLPHLVNMPGSVWDTRGNPLCVTLEGAELWIARHPGCAARGWARDAVRAWVVSGRPASTASLDDAEAIAMEMGEETGEYVRWALSTAEGAKAFSLGYLAHSERYHAWYAKDTDWK